MVDDYMTGLKCLMYLQSVEELSGWNGQSFPTPRHQKGHPVPKLDSLVGKVGVLLYLSSPRIEATSSQSPLCPPYFQAIGPAKTKSTPQHFHWWQKRVLMIY